MRDRSTARPQRGFVMPVGAHSVGDRRCGRPRSGLLRAKCDANANRILHGRANDALLQELA